MIGNFAANIPALEYNAAMARAQNDIAVSDPVSDPGSDPAAGLDPASSKDGSPKRTRYHGRMLPSRRPWEYSFMVWRFLRVLVLVVVFQLTAHSILSMTKGRPTSSIATDVADILLKQIDNSLHVLAQQVHDAVGLLRGRQRAHMGRVDLVFLDRQKKVGYSINPVEGASSSGIARKHRATSDATTHEDDDVNLIFADARSTELNKQLQSFYTFGADRFACDGQCMYCSSSHTHARWSRIREILTTYKSRHDEAVSKKDYSVATAWHQELQKLMDWSWERHKFECIPGIINLRMASYCYTSMTQFLERDDSAHDFVIQLNSHTGVLDLLQSAWPQLLQGGWPVFMLLSEMNRKMKSFVSADGTLEQYPKIYNESECDAMDSGTPFVEEYLQLLPPLLERGLNLELGHHIGLFLKRPKCPVGLATAMLGVAAELISVHGIHMSSMEETHNVIFVLVTAAQDIIVEYAKTKSDLTIWYDLLLTKWPLWKMLDKLSCKSSATSCVVRSEQKCYLPMRRQYVNCDYYYARPFWKPNYALCGEHDVLAFSMSSIRISTTQIV